MSEPALQGSLTSFRLPDVLTFLSASRKSGTLVLTGNGRHSYALFSNGALVYAGSEQEKFRLSALLVRRKKLTREQLHQAEAAMKREGGRFGQIAVQLGFLTDEQLRESLKVQVSEVLYDAFVWTEGTFRFSEELELPEHAVTISVDLSNLIMEGARRIDQWEQCVKLLPDDRVVFRVVSAPKDDKITLSADEWKILFLVNGQRTLSELVAEAEDDAFNVYRVIFGLLSNHLIEPVRPAASSEDTNRVTGEKAVVTTHDDTVRQRPGDATVLEENDDSALLLSRKTRLTWSEAVKKVVAQLRIGNGDSAGRIIPLTEAEYNLGRQRENTIQITDLGVSGYHARIFRTTEGYVIEDLKSRNGTWVNGGRVFNATLKDGDRLRMGATELRYEVLFDVS